MLDYASPVATRVEGETPTVPMLEGALRAAVDRVLCDACIGRMLGGAHGSESAAQRGAAAREQLGAAQAPARECTLCEGMSDEYDDFARAVTAALEGYEYASFLIGCTVDDAIAVADAKVPAALGFVGALPLKQEVTREVGLRVERASGKRVEFKDPDIAAVVDTRFNAVNLQVKSAYFRGRYRKLARGIPQTRWPCNHCRGRGCKRCAGTGRMYAESVEEFIARPLMQALHGEDFALHGAGREDIDARMLGAGRPFAVEIRRPQRRTPDRATIEAAIREGSTGRVEVEGLVPCSKSDVAALKASAWRKTYRVLVALEKDIKDDQINAACVKLTGTVVSQQTPTRVVHRRADMARSRTVERVELARKDGLVLELRITGESGLYIKELIHGDEGRTQPNLSELLGVACEVRELDVMQIHET
jgi:tRNA pseudouridine synthase 10